MTTSTIEFTKTSIPARARSGRTPLPNPFMEAFPADKEALEFTVAEGKDSVEGRRALRQIRQAAKHHDRTGRTTFEENEDGSCKVITWTVARVSRDGSPVKPVRVAKKTAAKKAAAKRTSRSRAA